MRATAISLLVIGFALAGCSDGGDGESADRAPSTTAGPFEPGFRLVPDQPTDPEQLDALAEVATARLVGAGADGARAEVDGDAVLVDVGASPLTDALAADLLDAPGIIGFQPVIEEQPFDRCPEGGEDDLAPEVDAEGQTVACYRLGPPLLDGSAVEGAEVTVDDLGTTVGLVFRAGTDGIDTFNEAAAACTAATEVCPQQRLAIVADGRVVSAPTIQAADFERDQIQVSGTFDEAGARRLAGVLAGGALPVPVTVVVA